MLHLLFLLFSLDLVMLESFIITRIQLRSATLTGELV